MNKEIFIGEFRGKNQEFLGNLYKISDGYIVREVKPFAAKPEAKLFFGRVYKASDLKKIGVFDAGYAKVNQYAFKHVDSCWLHLECDYPHTTIAKAKP